MGHSDEIISDLINLKLMYKFTIDDFLDYYRRQTLINGTMIHKIYLNMLSLKCRST